MLETSSRDEEQTHSSPGNETNLTTDAFTGVGGAPEGRSGRDRTPPRTKPRAIKQGAAGADTTSQEGEAATAHVPQDGQEPAFSQHWQQRPAGPSSRGQLSWLLTMGTRLGSRRPRDQRPGTPPTVLWERILQRAPSPLAPEKTNRHPCPPTPQATRGLQMGLADTSIGTKRPRTGLDTTFVHLSFLQGLEL